MKLMKIIASSFLIICFFVVSLGYNVKAKDRTEKEGPEVTDYFTVIDESGNSKIVYANDIENDDNYVKELMKEYNIVAKVGGKKEIVDTVDTKEEAEKFVNSKKRMRSSTTYSIEEQLKDITYGTVYLKGSKESGKAYLTYDNISNPGYDGYTTGDYAKDAAYIGTFDGKIRAMQAGVIMEFDSKDVDVIDYTSANISHYYISGGYLYHRYYYGTSSSSAQKVGYSLNYMSEGKKYYSYDGHYFYDTYPKMINDYKNNVRTNSVNKNNPYYNYYQFVSHRSSSSYSSTNFNSIVNDKVGSSTSKMKNLGSYYVDYQNTYGVNSLLMFGVSGNESAWGTSKIARDKNNLFGHGAVDSNPYYGANGYDTPSDSIKYHAEKFISNGYLDNEDWRYNGGHLGDKESGINVRYASDPYWGEKAASVHYYYEKVSSDYGKKEIGIVNGVAKNFKLYQKPSYSSPIVHTLGASKSPRVSDLPVIILDKVSDSSGNTWYKIQSDTALNDSRTDTDWDAIYNFSRDYVYIPSKDVTIINQTDDNSTAYLRGDVNGDGKVNSLDYVQIENHIMGRKILSGDRLKRADVDYNGKINALDYVKIENHIMGRNLLF